MIICVLLLGFNACSDEDDIHVNVEDSWYNLEDDPSDPVQHYIYQFYKDYQTIIIKDPEVEDYRYNFKRKNNIKVVAPVQEAALLTKGLDMVKDIFIEVYPESFKKKYFPLLWQIRSFFWAWKTKSLLIIVMQVQILSQ